MLSLEEFAKKTRDSDAVVVFTGAGISTESGVPDYAATNWYGLLAPAKTPAAIIDRINRDMTAALKSPDVIENLKARGIDAAPNSPAEFGAFIRAESVKWRPIVQQSGIKPDGG